MTQSNAAAPEGAAGLAKACDDLVRSRRRAKTDSYDLEDIAQDAYLRALTVPEPERIRDPVRYVLRIARNLFVDRKRQRIRQAALFGATAAINLKPSDAADPERVLSGKQELERALAAIGALPPRCREAFTLHRFDGLSYAAIARRMGISASMVEKHIAEAMVKIVRAMHNGEGGS
jgi:RNA polymerase sigma factor (sigma-70 family)